MGGKEVSSGVVIPSSYRRGLLRWKRRGLNDCSYVGRTRDEDGRKDKYLFMI